MTLAGKVALVTGAGRGIGRGIALRLARELATKEGIFVGISAGAAVACALVLPAMSTAALAPFPQMAGSAASLQGFVQMGGGLVGEGRQGWAAHRSCPFC